MIGIIENICYVCLLFFYYPLYLAGLLAIQAKLYLNHLKLTTGLGMKHHGVMLPLSKRSKVCDVGVISTEEEIDFLTHRSSGYLRRMTLSTAKEIARFITRHQKMELISDSQLGFVLFHTVYAYYLEWDECRKMYCFDLSEINKFVLFENFFWEAQKVYVNPATLKVIIVMEDGVEYHSDCCLHEKPSYDLAKLHLQVCLSYYAPGLAHNYVHFVFPSSVCIHAKTILSKESILYRLLSPHFRFMERLNHQALRICHASSNMRTVFDRFFCFWKPFPITKEQFSSTITSKLDNYYFQIGAEEIDVAEKSTDTKSMSNGTNELWEDEMLCQRKHSLFPPPYVTDEKLQKIPYLNFLQKYYCAVREFIQEMEPFIDREEWKELSEAIAVHVPRFEHVGMVDAISSFIHMVSVVHSADHIGYTDYFASRYGCMTIRSPFEPFSNRSYWDCFCSTTGISMQKIKENPLALVYERDIMRMRCFINVFVDYIPSASCDLSLIKTEYAFGNPEAEVVATKFKSNLRCLDGNLKNQDSTITFPKKKGDIRPTGMQLVKVENFISSNCY